MSLKARTLSRPLATVVLALAVPAAAMDAAANLKTCRLTGLAQDALCGQVRRPLDPAAPQGVQIDVHFAVLPALARNKLPDPIFFLAGGPGQSAIALAPPLARQFSRSLNRRDVVLVDQRGTGRSAPLDCGGDSPGRPLRDADLEAQIQELAQCRERLQKLPHGDLRYYTTAIAMADLEAVRQALGAPVINLVGGSYGTRAALEYQRQFPSQVRRSVIDGVAPPDMVLPLSFGEDGQAALQAFFKACDADAICGKAYGPLQPKWDALLASLPRSVTVPHPLSGQPETFMLTADMLRGWVRLPLYVPALTAALPQALHEASLGPQASQARLGPLLGLVSSFGGGRSRASRMATGQHFSVICAEDAPLMAEKAVAGKDGLGFASLYGRVCAQWPRGSVPKGFYDIPAAQSPVLVLSGGGDPVTPPRHGERVAQALGAQARHVVVPGAGHGVIALPCMRDAVHRFIDAADGERALGVDASCADKVPRASTFRPVQASSGLTAAPLSSVLSPRSSGGQP